MNKSSEEIKINRIEKRAIEAQAVAPLIRAFAQKIGMEEALAILREVNEQEAFQRGKSTRESGCGNGIDALAADVATWGDGGIMEMEVLEQTPTTYYFNVIRCLYYDKYRELGLEEFGEAFSCCRDEPHARGFNPQLKLARTKTLMEGADHCDFRYFIEKDE